MPSENTLEAYRREALTLAENAFAAHFGHVNLFKHICEVQFAEESDLSDRPGDSQPPPPYRREPSPSQPALPPYSPAPPAYQPKAPVHQSKGKSKDREEPLTYSTTFILPEIRGVRAESFYTLTFPIPQADHFSDGRFPVWCAAPDCPIHDIHFQGQYLWEGYKKKPHDVFGDSSPPPYILEVLDRLEARREQPRDKATIAAFVKYHYHICAK